MSLGESFYYLQDRVSLGKVFAREGRVGDNVEIMTPCGCLQRQRLGTPQAWAGPGQTGPISWAVTSGSAVSCPSQGL